MAKPQILREAHLKNESDQPIEILIPVDEKVRVHYDQDRFSYEVSSSQREQASVVLQPGDRLEQL